MSKYDECFISFSGMKYFDSCYAEETQISFPYFVNRQMEKMNDFDKRNKEYVLRKVEMEQEEDMELERVDQDLLYSSSSDEDEGPDVCVPQKV